MVKSRYSNTSYGERRTDKEGKGYRPDKLIRRCQGLAEG